jgi:ABC-type transport system involved in Fe-S cluster assembly fused permease/ATPase subunit
VGERIEPENEFLRISDRQREKIGRLNAEHPPIIALQAAITALKEMTEQSVNDIEVRSRLKRQSSLPI